MKKDKTLCELSEKQIIKHWDELVTIISDPRYICKKCARSSHTKSRLCKPQSIQQD